MKNRNKSSGRDMSIRQLKRELRGLGSLGAPERLKAALLDGIPDAKVSTARRRRRWLGHSREVAAAVAAVFLIAVMALAVDRGLSVSSHVSLSGFTDVSLSYPRWDLNGFMFDHNNSVGEEGAYLQ